MLLSLNKCGSDFEVYDLDDPNSQPIAYFKERWRAVRFMKQQEKE